MGIISGTFFFFQAIEKSITDTGIENGPWVTNTAYGDKDADPFLKSGVARRGLMALKKSETVYFTAYTDSMGRALSDRCSYHIKGTAPETRWWSFTLYGDDNFLIDNIEDKYSIFMNPDSNEVDFVVAPDAPVNTQNWLSSRGGGELSITLRLYNPAPSVYDALAITPLPTITKGTCS